MEKAGPVLVAILIATFGAFCAWLLVGKIFWFCQQKQVLDIPCERSSHKTPIPTMGGIGVVLPTFVLVSLYCLFVHSSLLLVGLMGGVAIAAIGLVDDVKPVKWWWKLAGQFVISLGVLYLLKGYLRLGEIVVVWPSIFLGVLVFIALMNAYNFMDGIDGMAGAFGVVGGLNWFIIGGLLENQFVQIFALMLMSTCFGFLLHNWSPARIFMGDVGSLFLGFSFAFLPLVVVRENVQYAALGSLFIWPMLYDTAFTFLIRLCRRENVFRAHDNHLYQRLTKAGLSHGSVTIIYVSLAVLGVLLVLCAWNIGPWILFAVILFLSTVPLLGLGVIEAKHRVHAEKGTCE